MLPIFTEEKSAFEFSQTLDLIYRETEKTPPVTLKATQQGFLLVETTLDKPRIVRCITQNLLAPATVVRLRDMEKSPRKELAEEHLRLYFELKRPFGLELPLEFTTDLLGGAAAPTGEARPGKSKPAIPYDVLHFPFITPGLAPEEPATGKTWKSAIVVRCGFGTFPLTYAAQWKARDLVHATAEMTFDPPTDQAKPAIFNGIHLRFLPAGTWTVALALLDGAPARGQGHLQYVVQATVPPAPPVTEVLNAKLAFRWRRIPLGFDNKQLLTASWAAMPPDTAP